MKTPCSRPNKTPKSSPVHVDGQEESTSEPAPLPQAKAPEPFTPLTPVGELYNKLFGDEPQASPTPAASIECTVARLTRPPSGESVGRHSRARAGASRTDVQVERLSEADESVTMATSLVVPGLRRGHRKSSGSRKKGTSSSVCNSSPTPHHQRDKNQEAVIVPSRRKTRSIGPSPSKNCDFRAMTTDAPMDVELSTQFRPPSSRFEAPTKERIMGGSGQNPIAKPPEEQFWSRNTRPEDESQDHIFGASEQMIRKGIKEWPVARSHKLKYRPRPGDDSQNKVCWWNDGHAEEVTQMEIFEKGEGTLRNRKYRHIPPDNIRELLDDESAAKAAAEYLAAERERRSRKRRPAIPSVHEGLVYSSYDATPENEILTPIITQKVLTRRGHADSQKRLFGDLEEHERRRKGKGRIIPDTKGRLFGDDPLHVRRYSSRPGAKTHAHSSIFSEESTKPESKMPLSARAAPNRNPISGEGLAPSSKSSTSCTMKYSVARGNPISGEGVPTPRAPAVSTRQASGKAKDSRCNPITGEGYNKNRREIWVTTCRI